MAVLLYPFSNTSGDRGGDRGVPILPVLASGCLPDVVTGVCPDLAGHHVFGHDALPIKANRAQLDGSLAVVDAAHDNAIDQVMRVSQSVKPLAIRWKPCH